MEKPAQLRAAITAVLPELGQDPDRLRMWVDKGRVRATSAGPSFAWEYTLSVYLDEYTGHQSVIVHLINQWLRANQPELLADGKTGYSFEADIISTSSADLLFELALSEDAIVTADPEGGWTIEHPGEPAPLLPDDLPLANPAGPLRQIWHNGRPDPRPDERIV